MPPRVPREPEEQAKEGAKGQMRRYAWWFIVGAVLSLFIPGGFVASIVLVVIAIITWRKAK